MDRSSLIHDARRFPFAWRMWFWLLQIVNLAAPLLFIGTVEGAATLAAYLVSAPTIVLMHRRLGWVRLLGIGHLPWLALLPWLTHRFLANDPRGVFAVWMAVAIAVDAISVVIDVVDVGRFIAGEREPIVG